MAKGYNFEAVIKGAADRVIEVFPHGFIPDDREVLAIILEQFILEARVVGRYEGWSSGYDKGASDGYSDGQADGYEEGYHEGQADANYDFDVATSGL